MKKTINILLAIAAAVPVALLFWPFATWNAAMSLILRVVLSLAVQVLLCRIGKWNMVKVLPTLFTGLLAAWGTYLYCTSPHWSNATLWGLIADYVSPFICCMVALVGCMIMQRVKKCPAL